MLYSFIYIRAVNARTSVECGVGIRARSRVSRVPNRVSIVSRLPAFNICADC
jgi:hypothetical protein